MAFNQCLDVAIPRFSYSRTLDEFPCTRSFDYSNPVEQNTKKEIHDFSLQLPVELSEARARVSHGCVDLRYDLVRHDPLRGEEVQQVGRRFVPAQPTVYYSALTGASRYKLTLAPLAAPLAAGVVDKNVAAAAGLIKILFPVQGPNEALSVDARATVRSSAGADFSPERFVWRLAVLWLAAAWAEINGEQLTTGTADTPPITCIKSVTEYSAILASWDNSSSPIAFHFEGIAEELTPLLSIIATATAPNPRLRTTGGLALPTIAHHFPELGNAGIYYVGPTTGARMPGDISSAAVWSAAELYCGQHGCMGLFTNYLNVASALWTGPAGGRDSIFLAEKLNIPLPMMRTGPTILIPVSTAYVTWREE
jgi:hypothetical protein